MASTLTHAGLSDPGLTHPGNEDRWLALADRGLYLVSDGMADALAPQMAVDLLPDLLLPRLAGVGDLADPRAAEGVRMALTELSDRIREEGWRRPEAGEPGATVVLALVRGGQALVAHLGDSRAYLWRAGRLEQLTRDHTRVRRLLDSGRISPEEAARYRSGGGPVRYLGMAGPAVPDLRRLDLRPGDQLLLCSDGLTGMVSDADLLAVLDRRLPPEEACRLLIAAANQAGGKDNVTALVLAV
jgi:protein phosphatase